MIASLLKQLGLALQEEEGLATGVVTQVVGTVAGVFYVDDARSAVDAAGRKVIAAQDFVAAQGIRSVFGFGGAYTARGVFVAVVLFAREQVSRRQAEMFMPLVNIFKAVTMRAAIRGAVFGEDVATG
ncbi:MAG TPA: hypothetical protein VFM29_05570, partial [Vicinamibacteria bacterium]|nr:hypothetical protein [Vicinamibacteria bacterium]